MGLLSLGEGLKPVGDLDEAFFARRSSHARVHVGVLVGLAGDGGLQVLLGLADGEAGRGVTDLREEREVAVCVAGLAFCGVAEQAGDIGKAFDVGYFREVEVTAVGLGLAGERGLEVGVGLGTVEVRHGFLAEMGR